MSERDDPNAVTRNRTPQPSKNPGQLTDDELRTMRELPMVLKKLDGHPISALFPPEQVRRPEMARVDFVDGFFVSEVASTKILHAINALQAENAQLRERCAGVDAARLEAPTDAMVLNVARAIAKQRRVSYQPAQTFTDEEALKVYGAFAADVCTAALAALRDGRDDGK